MELVIDSNVLISAIISVSGGTRRLLFSDEMRLFAPEFLLGEFAEHRREILEKSKLSEGDFEIALSLISSRVMFVPKAEFEQFISQAREICPDAKDTEFLALALAKGIPLWSNDKALKNQEAVKVYSTAELIETLGGKK